MQEKGVVVDNVDELGARGSSRRAGELLRRRGVPECDLVSHEYPSTAQDYATHLVDTNSLRNHRLCESCSGEGCASLGCSHGLDTSDIPQYLNRESSASGTRPERHREGHTSMVLGCNPSARPAVVGSGRSSYHPGNRSVGLRSMYEKYTHDLEDREAKRREATRRHQSSRSTGIASAPVGAGTGGIATYPAPTTITLRAGTERRWSARAHRLPHLASELMNSLVFLRWREGGSVGDSNSHA